jgi:precorrin-3B methylase
MFKEIEKGKKVAFITRGHPLVFGALARELVKRCKAKEIAHETFGAVSSIDHILAAMGRGLGEDFAGVQAFDRPAIESAKALHTGQPLLACFYDGLKGAAVGRFSKTLERFYPGSHDCRMFGPKYDTAPEPVRISELEKKFPKIHPSLILYVPAL